MFFFYPLARILWVGLNPAALLAVPTDSFLVIRDTSLFTFYQSILSTLLTLALGLPAAFLFARYDFRGKSFLRTLTAIPFMLPTVVVAAGFTALLGPRGWMNLALMHLFGLATPPIVFTGTLGAILLAHIFYNTTIVIRIVGNAIAHLDPRLEQAARTLGADPCAGLLAGDTGPVTPIHPGSRFAGLYLRFHQFWRDSAAGRAGLFHAGSGDLYAGHVFLQPATGRAAFAHPIALHAGFFHPVQPPPATYGCKRDPACQCLRPSRTPCPSGISLSIFSILLFIFYVLPLSALPLRSVLRLEADEGQRGQVHYGLTGDYYNELFVNRNDSIFYVPPFDAIGNSLGYAGLTVILSLLLGFPVATALAHPGRLARLLDPLLMLPLGASAVTLGLGLIITFNKPIFATQFMLVSSPMLVPIAHTIIALPFVIRTLQPALASIPERLRQAAAMLGASPRRVWFAVDWPIVSRATLSAAVFAFTISLGEFGASSLVVRPEYPTLPIAIAAFPLPSGRVELWPGHGHGDHPDGGMRPGYFADRAAAVAGRGRVLKGKRKTVNRNVIRIQNRKCRKISMVRWKVCNA